MQVSLLPIQIRDLEMIFHWRNHKEVAKWSAGEITMDDHWEWFLKGEKSFRWVFYLDNSPYGFIKFEPIDSIELLNTYRWSFYLNPFETNKPFGLGTLMLQLAMTKLRTILPDRFHILGECHEDNIPSLKIHHRLGFKEIEPDREFRRFLK